ncbi:MAG: hypothetical protein DRJ03_23140 [Chloroflexi bacterium]|nr:MAG: hypothetical protein DRJ03_23140 [Chloroflexota bacterium]
MSTVARQKSDRIQAGLAASASDIAAELDHLVIGINDNHTRLSTAETTLSTAVSDIENVERGQRNYTEKAAGSIAVAYADGEIIGVDPTSYTADVVTLPDPASVTVGARKTVVGVGGNYAITIAPAYILNAPDSVELNPYGWIDLVVVEVSAVRYWTIVGGYGLVRSITYSGDGLHSLASNVDTIVIDPAGSTATVLCNLEPDWRGGFVTITILAGSNQVNIGTSGNGNIYLDGTLSGASETFSGPAVLRVERSGLPGITDNARDWYFTTLR